MPIHHAIAKKAQKSGIIMEDLGGEEDSGWRYKAFWPEYNQVMFGAEPKYLLDDMMSVRTMRKEYHSFSVTIEDDNTVSVTVRGTNIEVKGLRGAAAFQKAKQLWMEARSELDIEDEEEDNETEAETDEAHVEDEEDRIGSVVSEKYRARYAEAGHPNNCGDWLAEILGNLTNNDAGFNLELFELICNANGIDMSKYKRESKGDRGRFRMTGRNLLGKIVFAQGELRMPDTINGGEPYKAPGEWMTTKGYKKPAPVAAPTPKKEG